MRNRSLRGLGSKASKSARAKHVEMASRAELHGRRAATWISIWDNGNRSARMQLLVAFVTLHADSNSGTMESDLGDAAPLLFTRLTSWLRLTYKSVRSSAAHTTKSNRTLTARDVTTHDTIDANNHKGGALPDIGMPWVRSDTQVPRAAAATGPSQGLLGRVLGVVPSPAEPTALLLLVKAITIFVRGARYLTQLVEVGGAATLTDGLACGTPTCRSFSLLAHEYSSEPTAALNVEERRGIIHLLLYIANAGRVYREVLSDDEGLVHLFTSLHHEPEADLVAMLTDLLMVLGQGNPRMAPRIHNGLIRVIIAHCSTQEVEGKGALQLDEQRTLGGSSATHDRGERSPSEVVLQCARALRSLQLAKEARFYGGGCRVASGVVLGGGAAHDDIDHIPIIGIQVLCDTGPYNGSGAEVYSGWLLAPVSVTEFLKAMFYLTLHDCVRYSVEGSEMLALAAKNIQLTRPILTRCFDVLDDDLLAIADTDDTQGAVLRHRHQMACGRVATMIVLSQPMSTERQTVIMGLIALRSAHMTFMKYLRLCDNGDPAAVLDCCRAIQCIARVSHAKAANQLHPVDGGAHNVAIAMLGDAIHAAMGDSLYHILLYEDVTEEEAYAMLRAARTGASADVAYYVTPSNVN